MDGSSAVIVQARRTLDIYVAPACFGCEAARALAAWLIHLALPDLLVRLTDLSAPDAVRPSAVFAVPTYVLDGQVVSLGNPDPDSLLTLLGIAAERPIAIR